MHIYVKTLFGTFYDWIIADDMTILELKDKITQETGHSVRKQRLYVVEDGKRSLTGDAGKVRDYGSFFELQIKLI